MTHSLNMPNDNQTDGIIETAIAALGFCAPNLLYISETIRRAGWVPITCYNFMVMMALLYTIAHLKYSH